MNDDWVPVRFVRQAQRCSFCGGTIPKGSPGSTKGTRGTKAWWNRRDNRWECLDCRTDGVRAEAAREAMDAQSKNRPEGA